MRVVVRVGDDEKGSEAGAMHPQEIKPFTDWLRETPIYGLDEGDPRLPNDCSVQFVLSNGEAFCEVWVQ